MISYVGRGNMRLKVKNIRKLWTCHGRTRKRTWEHDGMKNRTRSCRKTESRQELVLQKTEGIRKERQLWGRALIWTVLSWSGAIINCSRSLPSQRLGNNRQDSKGAKGWSLGLSTSIKGQVYDDSPSFKSPFAIHIIQAQLISQSNLAYYFTIPMVNAEETEGQVMKRLKSTSKWEHDKGQTCSSLKKL